MANWAKEIPTDKTGNPMQEFNQPYKAWNRTTFSAAVSSVLTLNDNTTVIEVASPTGALALRWVPITETAGVGAAASVITAADNTNNYDHIIPGGGLRRFVVPKETAPSASIVGANKQNGLYNRVAFKPLAATASSVLVSEF